MKISVELKPLIINRIIEQVEIELANGITSANNAHLASVDEQSVAETQYDTLAIEASYLAEGHSRRVAELKKSLQHYQAVIKQSSLPHQQVSINSLVTLINDNDEQHYFYIGESAGGLKVVMGEHTITVISLLSPLGKAIAQQKIDDDYVFQAGNTQQAGYIADLC